MTAVLIGAVLALGAMLYVAWKSKQEQARMFREAQAELEAARKLEKKTEAIKNEQAAKHERVDTGGLAGSLDVLSDLSAKRPSRRSGSGSGSGG